MTYANVISLLCGLLLGLIAGFLAQTFATVAAQLVYRRKLKQSLDEVLGTVDQYTGKPRVDVRTFSERQRVN